MVGRREKKNKNGSEIKSETSLVMTIANVKTNSIQRSCNPYNFSIRLTDKLVLINENADLMN